MTLVEGKWRRLIGCLLLPCVLAVGGCNIFSWTHDEGSSDDPETLLQDAEDALLDQEWDEALAAAKKGIELDPNLDFPRLRYVASQAVLGASGVSISSYYNVFTSQAKPGLAGKGDGGLPRLADELLDLSLEELIAIATACPQAVAFLDELLEGLESGQITPADLLGIQFDVEIGFGVGALLTAFVTTLDVNQDLSDGFQQTECVTIQSFDDGGYAFTYGGTNCPGDPNTFIRQTLLCPLWTLFCDGLNAIYDAYRTAATPGDGWPEDIVCTVAAVGLIPTTPPLDDSYVAGQILDYVRDGIALLQQTYLGPGCP